MKQKQLERERKRKRGLRKWDERDKSGVVVAPGGTHSLSHYHHQQQKADSRVLHRVFICHACVPLSERASERASVNQ